MLAGTDSHLRKSASEQRLHSLDGSPTTQAPATGRPTRKSSFRALAAAWNADRPTRSGTGSASQTPISAKYPSPTLPSPGSSLASPATPWLSPDSYPSTSKLPSTIRQSHAPTIGLSFAPRREHSRSGSSSGYETAATHPRSLSYNTDPSYHTLKSQYEIKRMMSKPAATSKDTHARPQTAVDGFSARIIRRTTSSDLNPQTQPELQRQLTNKSLQKIQDSFLSFSPLETESPSPFGYPGSAVASEPSPPPELKRKRSLLRKPRPPLTPQTPYSSRDPPSASPGSFLPSPSPKVLTPAASLIEEYKESERRRAKLAQAAGEAFAKPVKCRTPSASPVMKDYGLPPSSPLAQKDCVPSRPATASGLDKSHIPEWLSDAPFSDYYVSLKHPPVASPLPISSPSAQPRKSVDRPSLRINIDSGSHSSRGRYPNSSFDLESRPKVPHPRGAGEFGDLAKKKHPPKLAETPSMESSSPQGSKLWKIVKRLSSSVLREKSVNEGIKAHDIPPVPVIPENFKGSSSTHPSRQSSLSPAIGNKYGKPLSTVGQTPLANREAKKRSSTTVTSSGLSSELAPSGFFAKQPPSNRSSTSSYGNDIVTIQFSRPISQSTRPATKSEAIETNPNYASHFPQSNTEPGSTEPVISQEVSDIDITDSPLIPTFSTKTAAVFNRFEQFDKAVNKAPLRGSKKRPSTSSGLRDAKQPEFSFPRVQNRTTLNTSARPSFFSPRKSTDATRKSDSKGRVEVDFGVERASRRRTRSLDRLLSGNSVTFRALDDPQLPLTEEQKARRWEELLRRSDLAGGTLSVSAGPAMS